MLTTIGRPRNQDDDLTTLLASCHERIRSFLELALRIGEPAGVTAADADVAEACASVERYFREALPLHAADEEESLLPRLAGLSVDLTRDLELMSAQHREHEPLVAALIEACARVRAAPGHAPARDALAAVARRLREGFTVHLALEERSVFPAVGALPPAEQARIRDEMRARRRP